MFFKKKLSVFFTVVFILSIFLPQIAMAQSFSDIAVIEDIAQIEVHIYGEVINDALLTRVELLEKELVGRTLPGILKDRVKQLKDFIITGTVDEPSLSFKINSAQWILQDEITNDPLLTKIEDMEQKIFGEISDDVLAMRAEKIFSVSFPEGKPRVKEVTIPAGMMIPIVLLEKISSKKNHDGDIFRYKVEEDITYAGSIIIPKNTIALGEVLKAKKASILLKKGQLELDFRALKALDGKDIRLIIGEASEEENARLGIAIGAGIAGLIILSNPVGLVAGALVPGKNVILKEGSKIYLEVAYDTTVISLIQ